MFVCLFVLAVLGLSCGMRDLVPRPGIKPGPPALGMWSLTRWTTREVPITVLDDHRTEHLTIHGPGKKQLERNSEIIQPSPSFYR